ncbi:hypothetical protein SC1_01632 [Sphingopyxis sp. C-1]|nr:hypothetical protein SC1_01632 [Sphingopyxis sp. C-1]
MFSLLHLFRPSGWFRWSCGRSVLPAGCEARHPSNLWQDKAGAKQKGRDGSAPSRPTLG